ncbi:MAG: hypothetical protein QXU12_05185 [Nitrososphaerota archaeon]
MAARELSVTREIIELIRRPSVVGLATHRHLPHERAIYMRHGRCGFAIDVLVDEGGTRKLYSILVEVEANIKNEIKIESLMKLGGVIRYQLSEKTNDGFRMMRRELEYRDGEELFHQVDLVRSAFYEKYRELKARAGVGPAKIEEEIFHQVGIGPEELLLGV